MVNNGYSSLIISLTMTRDGDWIMEKILKTEFINILEKTKEIIESANLKHITRGEDFEDHVVSIIKEVSDCDVVQTGKQSFPDIIVGGHGVEVKFSKSNKWESIGNSIFEGTFRDEVTEEIYVLFGRKINEHEVKVKFNLYENCLADVKITHSPRFYINMELLEEGSILNEVGISYDVYRKLPSNEKGTAIKKYLKSKLKPGELVWWMDERESSTIIKKFRTLEEIEQNKLRAELFSLFPEVVSNSTSKFERAQLHLLNNHQVTFSRDLFTAGGQVTLILKSEYVMGIPAIFGKLFKNAQFMRNYINNTQCEKLYDAWFEHEIVSLEDVKKDKIGSWLKQLDALSMPLPNNLLPSVIFQEGLKNPTV